MTLDRSVVWPYREGEPGEFVYQRFGHPAGVAAERALGELDGGRALLFASGAAAMTAVALAVLRPGCTVALAEGAYYGTLALFRELEPWGVRCVEFDQTGPPPSGADLVWLEAPSNPFLTMPDLDSATVHPAPVVVDATVATPIFLRPLDHGADVVLHSGTKYLSGHSDLLIGAAVCRADELFDRLKRLRDRTGGVAPPDSAWMLLRSLKTLRLRVERQSATAAELSRRLARHPAVELVRYPGLGGLLSFDVRGNAVAVERATQVIVNATSLGGSESSIETRARWEGDRVPSNLLRLSVGLEDVEELWHDLEQALSKCVENRTDRQ